MTTTIYNENAVRRLRDSIYGTSSETNWKNCRDHWMTPDSVRWLAEQNVREMKTDRTVEQLINCCVERHEISEP